MHNCYLLIPSFSLGGQVDFKTLNNVKPLFHSFNCSGVHQLFISFIVYRGFIVYFMLPNLFNQIYAMSEIKFTSRRRQ